MRNVVRVKAKKKFKLPLVWIQKTAKEIANKKSKEAGSSHKDPALFHIE